MKFALLLASTALTAVARAFDGVTSVSDALSQLDPKNDAHWTADGLPRIDILKSLTGDTGLNRQAIETAKPGFNRELAGGENRTGNGVPQTTAATAQDDPLAAALADGWQPHPTAAGYHYKGQDVVADTDLAARYPAAGAQSAPSGGSQQASEPSEPAQDLAADISAQTGVGGTTTARSPLPVEGEPRKTHVSEPSNGEPGEKPVGIVQGVTGAGENLLGTPEGTVQNVGRSFDLSGEVAARNAGSVLTPAQAPAESSNSPGISLGGAADPFVEARAPGGAVVAEGADPATFFEGETVGGPFGASGVTAGDGKSQAELAQMGRDFEGDPETVEALTAELGEAEARTTDIRSQIDSLTADMNASVRNEARLRRQIEANRPRSGTMDTIQAFLRSQQERRAAAVRDQKN